MRFRMWTRILIGVFGAAISALGPAAVRAGDDTPNAKGPPILPTAAKPTITLAPSVVLVKSKPGQGLTQAFRMSNFTPAPFRFDIEVQDVLVQGGKRLFVPAGETAGGIAATAVASPRSIVVAPQTEGTATVTLTVPPETAQRAVVVYFRGRVDVPAEEGSVSLGASLGALVVFSLGTEPNFGALNFSAAPQTENSNLAVLHELVNTGGDVVMPKGSMAIVDASGRRVSKAIFDARRLLPGERQVFKATNPSQLKPGRYRVVSSFEYAGRIVITGGDILVQ